MGGVDALSTMTVLAPDWSAKAKRIAGGEMPYCWKPLPLRLPDKLAGFASVVCGTSAGAPSPFPIFPSSHSPFYLVQTMWCCCWVAL
jgi:hypothetical protein